LLFYRYASLYDIAQLLLPIAVVVTASVLDQNRKDPLTVQQLYLILSLLGICYRPMKDFRTLSISLNDGFHSLRRITDYLQLREEQPRSGEYHRTPFKPASISIAKGTSGLVKGNGSSFEMSIKFHL
jgi:ABC-type multidrug transport system fused ATPase/permease subunit